MRWTHCVHAPSRILEHNVKRLWPTKRLRPISRGEKYQHTTRKTYYQYNTITMIWRRTVFTITCIYYVVLPYCHHDWKLKFTKCNMFTVWARPISIFIELARLRSVFGNIISCRKKKCKYNMYNVYIEKYSNISKLLILIRVYALTYIRRNADERANTSDLVT